MFKRYKKIILLALITLALVIAATIVWRLGNWHEKTEPENGASANVSPDVNVLDQIDLAKEAGGEAESIPLLWTDNNDKENLIITSDRQYYDASSEVKVYFSVKNTTGQDQLTDIYFWFDDENKSVSEVKSLQDGQISNFQFPILNEFSMPEFSNRKSVKDYKTGSKFQDTIVAGQTNYYLATITSPKVSGQSEFFIEAFSDKGAYGHLDPYLNSGLVGYWSFNGPDIKNTADAAYDRSGSYATGTMTNMATSSRSVPGITGQALSFDGSDDYVKIGDVSPDTALTVSAWVKPDEVVNNHDVIRYRLYGYLLRVASNEASFTIVDSTTASYTANSSHHSPAITILKDTWYHLVGVYDGSKVYIYVNNVLADQANAGVLFYGAGYASIGRAGDYDSTYFDGVIDEFRVYNRALNAGEIKDLYNTGAAKAKTNIAKTKAYTSGLVGYWSFNGPDISNNANAAYDRSGSYATGTMTNMATSTRAVPGISGQALKFDGVDDYVSFPDRGFPTGSSPSTISLWIKANPTAANLCNSNGALSSYCAFLVYGAASTNQARWIGVTKSAGANILISFWNNEKDTTIDYTEIVGSFHHLVWVYDGTNSIIYLDNALRFSQAHSGLNTTLSSGRINSDLYDNDRVVDGFIDEVRIYNRALSAAEITNLYNTGAAKMKTNTATTKAYNSGLVGNWTFNGPDISNNADAAYDRSGSYATGTMINMATSTRYAQGISGQALSFDGVDDYVTMGLLPQSTILTTNQTVSFWFKPKVNFTSAISRVDFISRYGGPFVMYGAFSGKLTYYYYNSAVQDGYVNYTSNFSAGTWYHIVGVHNASNAYLYINGMSVGTPVNIDMTTPLAGSFETVFGKIYSGGGFINAVMDEVRIYNRALSADEIKSLYQLGARKMKVKQ